MLSLTQCMPCVWLNGSALVLYTTEGDSTSDEGKASHGWRREVKEEEGG